MNWAEKYLKDHEGEINKLVQDLASFNNTNKQYELNKIFQKGEFSNNSLQLMGILYSKKELIKKIGIKYYLLFWKRKLYLQRQIYSEIHGDKASMSQGETQ